MRKDEIRAGKSILKLIPYHSNEMVTIETPRKTGKTQIIQNLAIQEKTEQRRKNLQHQAEITSIIPFL